MSKVKLAIVYYSSYGTNYAMAEAAAKAAEEAGAEVRLRKVPETAPAEVVKSVEAWNAQAAAELKQLLAEAETLENRLLAVTDKALQ